jgi:hypothetical protein
MEKLLFLEFYTLPRLVPLLMSDPDDGGYDDEGPKEQGNAGEDTGDSASAGYGDDYPRQDDQK